jgi:hypothetical protein
VKRRLTVQRGSAVLVALCLTVVLGIAVIGYVAVCARTMEMSNRSFCTTSSVQLAEIGVEEALWTLNKASQAYVGGSSYGWSGAGWTLTTPTINGVPVPTATKTLTGFVSNRGLQGSVNIKIEYYSNNNLIPPLCYTQPPTITSDGISQMPDGFPIDKQLKLTARPAALFTKAVGAYTSTSFTINWICPLDSYETHVNLDPASSLQTRKDEAIVSAPTVSVNAANISGYVATAGTAPTYTTGGTVKRADTPGDVTRDLRYVFTNANQTLFDILADANLPGTYAGAVPSGTATLSPTVLSRYTATNLFLTGWTTLTIDGPAIIVVSGDFYIGDTAKILITANGSAQIIVGGSTYIGGGGVDNRTKLPKNLAVMSRSAGSYSWSPDGYYTAKFETSTPFYGVIYVPNGSLSVCGNPTIYGALAANVVDQHYGNGAIHYDLDLRKAVFSTLNTPFDVAQWLVSN